MRVQNAVFCGIGLGYMSDQGNPAWMERYLLPSQNRDDCPWCIAASYAYWN